MSVPHPWLLILCIMALLLILGATSGLVNARLWVSEPLVCAAAGVFLGLLGFAQLDPGNDTVSRIVLREAARVTLAIAVVAAAIRLPRGWLRRHWRGLAVALGPGMLLMWAAGAATTAATLHLPPLTCALIGAIIAPTDPVLSAPVVTGRLARRAVPAALRHAITAESGINDGLAQPFVMLPLFLIMQARGGNVAQTVADWGVQAILVEVGGAVLVGIIAGSLAHVCLRWAGQHPDADPSSLLTIALALAVATLAALEAVGSDGVLGAFIAGVALNEAHPGEEQEERQERFNEAVGRFFDLPIMVLLGLSAPWQAWFDLGWGGLAFAVGVLLLRRIPAWLLLRRWMPWTRSLPQALFAGWFGPIGAAALFYACGAQETTGLTVVWPVVSLAAAASVVAHGVSGTPLALRLGRWRGDTGIGVQRTESAGPPAR